MRNLNIFLIESNAIESVFDTPSLKKARQAWDYLIKCEELTQLNILHTHGILMAGKLPLRETGAYRTRPVYIGGHQAKPWFAIPELMSEWIKDAHTSVKVAKDENIKLDHISFEAIHPFIDGNGRMGRILLNWQRIKAGLPILVISYEQRKDYYQWFPQYD